jgi:flagellar assembly protein FliH
MSTSSEVVRPGRIVRGAAAARFSGAPLDQELLRPQFEQSAVDADVITRVVAEARAAGHAEGLAAGLAEGRERAHAVAAAEIDALTGQLQAALHAVERAAAELTVRQAASLDDVEDAVVAAGFRLAESIVGRELACAESPGRDAIARAMRVDLPAGALEIRLHPDDAVTVGDIGAVTGDRSYTISPDATVERGGCIVRAGTTTVDAQLGPALDRAREVLGA